MASVGLCFDQQILKIVNRCQCIDNASLKLYYPLIHGPNNDTPYIENVEHVVVNNFGLRPLAQIWTESAQNGLQDGHRDACHVLGVLPSWRPCSRAPPPWLDMHHLTLHASYALLPRWKSTKTRARAPLNAPSRPGTSHCLPAFPHRTKARPPWPPMDL
jgi:hypothetical protein